MSINNGGVEINGSNGYSYGMRKLFSILLILLLTGTIFAASFSQERLENPFPSEENLLEFDFKSGKNDLGGYTVHLVTIDTGDEVYTYFGHSSLEVEDPAGNDVFFDYGYFSFDDGFYLDFAFGRLYYMVSASPSFHRMAEFENEGRTVREVALELDDAQKEGIINFLNYNIREDNRTYLYHYYDDNCATRVRDIINAATDGEFRAWAEAIQTGWTKRESASAYLDKDLFFSFVINYLEGPYVDKPMNLYQAMYLPEVLETAVNRYQGTESTVLMTDAYRTKYAGMPFFAKAALLSLLLLLLSSVSAFSKNRLAGRICDILMAAFFLFMTILSAVLLFMMLFTDHDVTYMNANILFINPALVVFFVESLAGRSCKKRGRLALLFLSVMICALILKGLFPMVFIQENLAFYMIMASVYIPYAVKWSLSCHRNRKGMNKDARDLL